jgi:hypothetical protein
MTTVHLSGITRDPLSFYGLPIRTSPLVPPGKVIVIGAGRDVGVIDWPTDRTLMLNPRQPRNRYGDPSWLERAVFPTPGYTPRTLGGRELARDCRRQRRGGRGR